ncbi:MAG: hypothetical protein F6K23_07020 [Okeania sp. SIO2C9]|uniref:hypothetical protein n=1 Tax=Okeania sp. SIO2C9 TaxID=2607791 RepID=UPI0013C0BF81|nr:hypothetical protein [Okeania sp. SIO2C9]NEQ72844.1 hypothetical protein [Okeania sp. SIO2C9]
MEGLTLGLTIAAAVIIVVGVGLGIVFSVFFQNMKSAGMERIQEQFPTEEIVRSEQTANFLGLKSRGRGQIRGNGVLALTRKELWFSRFVIRDDISIPTESIQEVRLVDSHLGKRIFGRQLLYVCFLTSDTIDAAAWLVADPYGWKRVIDLIKE